MLRASPDADMLSCSVVSDSLRTIDYIACQAPLSMGFSRQEYWSGWPVPPPGDLPDPGIEPKSPAFQADSLPLSHQGSPGFIQLMMANLTHQAGWWIRGYGVQLWDSSTRGFRCPP